MNKTWEIKNIDSIHNTTLHREPLECTKVHEVRSANAQRAPELAEQDFHFLFRVGGEKKRRLPRRSLFIS